MTFQVFDFLYKFPGLPQFAEYGVSHTDANVLPIFLYQEQTEIYTSYFEYIPATRPKLKFIPVISNIYQLNIMKLNYLIN